MTPWRVALSVHPRALLLDQHDRYCGHAFIKVYFHVISLEWRETEVGRDRKWQFRLSNNINANKILDLSKTQSASVLMVFRLLILYINLSTETTHSAFQCRCYYDYMYLDF